MRVLGIETSCDETAAGIVEENPDPARRILAHIVASQLAEHRPYGGVVPEIAARAHLDRIDDIIREALKQGGSSLNDLDGVAATCGPGLIGGVMVGAMTGKAIAAAKKLPFIAVNHLEAHALTVRLTHNLEFPYLLLLVSGGHCQLLLVSGVGVYRRLGTTIDDAAGECLDKSAKLLGLGYPGGPMIELAAREGNPRAFTLPRPMLNRQSCDFSFAGLKTAVREIVLNEIGTHTKHASEPEERSLSPPFVSDMAASLQAAISDVISDRVQNAFSILEEEKISINALVTAGGVAANQLFRERLSLIAAEKGLTFIAPPAGLCTDNGAMVAWAGIERLRLGMTNGLDFAARPRWPLES